MAGTDDEHAVLRQWRQRAPQRDVVRRAEPRLQRKLHDRHVGVRIHPQQRHPSAVVDSAAAVDAGKHVYLEKPIAMELHEADELVALARRNKLKFTIGYSQRFNPKFAYVKKSIASSHNVAGRCKAGMR